MHIGDPPQLSRRVFAMVFLLLSLLATVFALIDFTAHPNKTTDTTSGVSGVIATIAANPPDATNSDGQDGIEEAPPSTRSAEDGYQMAKRIEALEAKLADLMEKSAADEARRTASRTEFEELQEAANDPFLRQQFGRVISGQQERQAEAVKERFSFEAVDPTWAPEALAAIESTLGDNVPAQARIVDVQCRTSACRVDLSLPESSVNFDGGKASLGDATSFDTDIALLSSLSTNMSRSTIRRQPDGSGGYNYELYLHRDGYEPPLAPNPMTGMTLPEMRAYLETL